MIPVDAEARFAAFMNHLPAAAFLKDSAGNYLYANPVARAILDIPPDADLGAGIAPSTLPPEVRAVLREHDQQVLRTGEPLEVLEHVPMPDGSPRTWHSFKFPFEDAGGQRLIGGIALDATERERAEAERRELLAREQAARAEAQAVERALRESQRFTQQITELVPATIYIYDLERGQNVYANRSIFAALGYTPGQVEAMGSEVFARLLHPEDLALLPGRLARFGSARDGDLVETLYRMRHASGAWRWLFSREVIFARHAGGQPSQVLGVAQDVTQQLEAIESVRASEERYRTLFETMAQGVVYQDGDGTIISANPAAERILGLTLDQLLGRKASDPGWRSIHEDGSDFPGATHPAMEALRSGEPVHDVVMGVYNPAEGRHRWINVNARPQFHPGEAAPFQVYTTFEDITARKEAEAEVRSLNVGLEARVAERTSQLEAAIHELEAFSYSVSHDLRAPLRAIDGFSRIVWEEYAGQIDEEAREYLRLVRDNTRHMGQLIDDLLAFSRLSRHPIQMQEVSMEALVRRALEDAAGERAGRVVELNVAPLPPCTGDPALLMQVWANLIANALKYTRNRPAARVAIGSRQLDGETVYSISDNGVGFDMRYAHKLFGVFQRLHRAEEYEGTGVGLAIVQRVIHRHGGRVWAEAEPGRGASFFFALPAGAAPEGDEVAPANTSEQTP